MMKNSTAALIFFSSLFILWEVLVAIDVWSSFILPAPTEIATYLIDATLDGTLPYAILTTLKRLFQGYLVGILVGIPLGLLNAKFEFCEKTLGLVLLGIQILPSICWAPLALLWFGQTEMAIFFIVFMGTIGSIASATSAGVQSIPPLYIRAARTMGSKLLHLLFFVILPAALPFIITGLKQSFAFAWRSLMAAEIYITILTGFGFGQLLHYGRELHSMDAVFGVMMVIIMIGLLIEKIFFSSLEKFFHIRWGTNCSLR